MTQRVVIDVDDTTFALYEKILSVFGQPKGQHYLELERTWPEFTDCIPKLINHAPFYADLRMLHRANEVINEIGKSFDVYFVTARPETVAFIQVTDQQLQKNQFKYKDLIIAGDKKLDIITKLHPHYLIDDMPKYLLAAYSIGAIPIRMRQPYNTQTSPAISVASWYEIRMYFNGTPGTN